MPQSPFKIFFSNFPASSPLLDEIIFNYNHPSPVDFQILNSSMQTLESLKHQSNAILIIFVDTPSDHIRVKSLLKQASLKDNSQIKTIALVSQLNTNIKKELRQLGVRNIYPQDYDLELLNDDIAKFVLFHKNKKTTFPDKIVISTKSAVEKPLKIVGQNDQENDSKKHIIQNAEDAILEKNISLDSGKLDVNIDIESLGLSEIQCQLDSFTANSVELNMINMFEIPVDTAISIKVIFTYNRCKVEVYLEGIIQQIDEINEYNISLQVVLNADENLSLENFMALYQKRQKSINDFMYLAKGH